MKEMFVLGITLAVAQGITALILMRIMFTKRFMKRMSKMTMELITEMEENED